MKPSCSFSSALRILCGMLFVAGTCTAQGVGTIYGAVTDPSGAGITGAKVTATLIERGTTRVETTSTSGEYVFSSMPIGTYSVEVTAAGFEQFRRQPITLNANQNVHVDAQLLVARPSDSLSSNSSFGIGVGPTDGASALGIGANVPH